MDGTFELKPTPTPDEIRELASIDYLLSTLESMRLRDLISVEAYRTVVSETTTRRAELERSGRFRGALTRAQSFVASDPPQALRWANWAREFEPGQPDGWSMEVDLLRRLHRDDEALALCCEAAERFPTLQGKLAELRRARQTSETVLPVVESPYELELEADSSPLPRAQAALKQGDDRTVIALCEPWVELHPDDVEVLVCLAFSLRRIGRTGDALTLYRRLTHLQPQNSVWPQWVRSLEAQKPAGRSEPETLASQWVEPEPVRDRPSFSWSSVAGEFLEEHWQKLILCLAVLLIVVSSTVGAHLLLGPRLWSPIGKCSLALVYTVMFAAFGSGLMRWGAERAGRMMLLTTLIVVPVNFMLAGEMRLLTHPTASRLAVLAVDVLALFLVTRQVARSLEWRSGATFLAVALIALSACDTAVARDVSFEWGFTAFVIPPWLFLGAIWWLNTGYQAESDEKQRSFGDGALGLLTFAFLSGLIRTAAVMHPMLHSCLFGVPVMLTAIACVHTAHHLARFEKDRRRTQLLRFGGYVLSALAFSLALSRPPGMSPLYSGNTLATALLGLVLYGASLRAYRHPAYLYFAFGSLFLGYFGAFYFLVDLLHSIEEIASKALGYQHKLPFAFKAINGLSFNLVLALLAILFSKRWKDERLVRHCHYIGIPLSIAACLLSAFEPKAALIVMSGYSMAFTLAIPVFNESRLVYLACGALSGALLSGSILWPGVTMGARVVGSVALGFSLRFLGGLLQARGHSPVYRRRLIHVALVLATAAIFTALVLILPPSLVTISVALAFLFAAWLCLLLLADLPVVPLAHLVVIGLLGSLLGSLAFASGRPISATPTYGVATGLLALGLLASAEWLRRRKSARSIVLAASLPDAVLPLNILAFLLSLNGGAGPLVPLALTLALSGVSVLWLTRFRRELILVYLGIGLVVSSQLVLGWGRMPGADLGTAWGALALISAGSALVLWRVGYVLRREGGSESEFYAGPCFQVALGMTAFVYGLALAARSVSRAAYPASALALVGDGLVLVLLTTAWRTPLLTYAGVASLVSATYLVLFSVGRSDPSMAYVLGLVAVVEGLALWWVGLFAQRGGRMEAGRLYARPLFVSALWLTLCAIPASLTSAFSMFLIALSLILMVKSFPSSGWLYAAMGALWWVLDLTLLSRLTPESRIIAAVFGTFSLWGVGVVARRSGPRICRGLDLPRLELARPFFNVAILSGYLALMLVVSPVLSGNAVWSAHAWVPLSLSIFCLLMVEAQAESGWVHAFALLASVGSLMAVDPWVTLPSDWLVVGMILSLFWLALGNDFLRVEPWICRRFSIEEIDAGEVLKKWSMFAFSIAGVLTGLLIAFSTVGAIFLEEARSSLMTLAGWFPAGPALGLAWIYVLARSERFGDFRPSVHFILQLLMIWWLGLSPYLYRHGVWPSDFDPPLTAAMSLVVVLAGRREVVGVDVSAYRAHLADRMAFLIASIACSFTLIDPTSSPMLGTLLLATATFGHLAVARHRVGSAYAAGLTWCVFAAFALHRFVRPWLISPEAPPAFGLACGSTLAIYLLWALSGWLRSTKYSLKSWRSESRDRVVLAFERVAVLGSFWTVALIAGFSVGQGLASLSDTERLACVGLLMALAGFNVLAARRWQAEWLVYVAQATLLGAYFEYRSAFPVSVSTDAAVLTLFGYLDLGLSEVMQRLRMKLYARPTLYVSLLVPLIPPVMAILDGRFDELSLFLMLTTAAFYAVACYTRQWKTLGYAAAVLLNAILWVAWSRVGWKLVDHPQFFLIPVGLSAILFAEVNRREFGNDLVNAIRGCGLALIYASLALPIWQFQSFGAWLTLLLLSLAGILVGIGLRIQTFLWLGLVGFVLDVVYQLGRVSVENALARWGVMLSLGILLILFVALNEKKRIVATMRLYYDQARQWE